MTDYTAHDIHRLDQAYPDALGDIDDLTGNPHRKARLAEVGPEVFAAELTRELADGYYNPMSIAAWAAVATVRLMVAGKAWEDDTDAAWQKVADRNASLDRVTAERDEALAQRDLNGDLLDGTAKTLGLDMDYAHVHHEILGKVAELVADRAGLVKATAKALVALTESRANAAKLANENGALVAENARLRQDRDTKADIAKNRADVITDLGEVIERVEQRANAHAAVVEAAKAWRRFVDDDGEQFSEIANLIAAVDALPKAEVAS